MSEFWTMSDCFEASEYAQESLAWCLANKIMSGMDGKICPTASATRAQTAKMVLKMKDVVAAAGVDWPEDVVTQGVPKPSFMKKGRNIEVYEYDYVSLYEKSYDIYFNGVTESEADKYIRVLIKAGFIQNVSRSTGPNSKSYGASKGERRVSIFWDTYLTRIWIEYSNWNDA